MTPGQQVYLTLEAKAKDRGVTLLDAAEAIGLSRSQVWRWRTGKANPMWDTVQALDAHLETLPMTPEAVRKHELLS